MIKSRLNLTITHANIRFNENGTPYATQFEDLYFSDAQGLDETTHVFVKNNLLLERWSQWSDKDFVIAETGFGTGLNVLVTMLHFENFCAQVERLDFNLHFISIEKFPISQADLSKALALYPQLAKYSQPLLEQYPMAIAGCHRLSFMDGKVTLDLWLGDVHQVLGQIDNKPLGLIDTWFLDGFAPSKNPDMWTQDLFNQMAKLAKDQCHFATFTAAGHVKRGLREAGFAVQKRQGHGRKRDMLAGTIQKLTDNRARLPYFIRQSAQLPVHPQIAIIGGGLAGANCAYALSTKGLQSTLYCQESTLAQGASGNAQGGFYPQLNAQAGNASLIHALSFTYASKLYRQLLSQGFDFTHQWCGTLQLAFNPKVTERYRKLIEQQTWPQDLIHWLDEKQTSQLANLALPYPGLFIPKGGWINLPELVASLTKAAGSQIVTNKKLITLKHENNLWQLNWQDGSQTTADIVVMATGSDSAGIQQLSDLPFRLVRGQVEAIQSQGELSKLSTVLCHKGYLTPAWKGKHALGSTYNKEDTNTDYRLTDQQTNIITHQKVLAKCDWINDLIPSTQGRAATRCSTPDHLPMVGAVPNIDAQTAQYHELYKALPAHRYSTPVDYPNLYMLCGLGSRGLTTAPLCAEILASQIVNKPLPLANNLLDALNPNRFLIRGLIRRQI
jgi:tRNA 5-methylaminomethyl-2-thiouridine biosynthesis bifunctional protein